jgi:hypothetical protein
VAGAGFLDKVAVLALAFGAGLVADGEGIHCRLTMRLFE